MLFVRVLLLLSLVCAVGCYPDWPDHAGTAVVRGKVTLDGLPLGDANVVFVPVGLHTNGTKLMPIAYGKTDAGGDFSLAYSDGTKELLAGRYNVIISKMESGDEGTNDLAPGLIPDSMRQLEVFSAQGEQVPLIYNRNSELKYVITSSPSIVRPLLELTSVDPSIKDLPLIDLPIQ